MPYHSNELETNLMNTPIATPFELLIDQLRALYITEVQLFDYMPHLVSLCKSVELRSLLVSHTQLNTNQIVEIAAIFERQGASSGNDKCKAMAGLIEEGAVRLERAPSPHPRDLMLVTLCRRIDTSRWPPMKSRPSFPGGWG